MILELTILILAAAAGGVLYRMGGASGYNTKFRDLGIPVIGTGLLVAYGRITHCSVWVILSLVFSFALMFAAQTTYFKKKGSNACWYHWALVGMANGLALLPWAIQTGQWVEFGIRTAVLVVLVTAWSQFNGNAVWEEVGRGVLIVLTLGLFLRRKKE